VLVADAPAFVVNRVLTRLMSVVLDALEHGTTPTRPTRRSSRLGLPMAPSVLLQMVGPRVANHVLGRCTTPTPTASRSRRRWRTTPRARTRSSSASRPARAEELLEAALEASADEIHHLLEEGVVAEAKDVDTALLLGAGWPFWLGGITKYLDQVGISERCSAPARRDRGGRRA
jgi:3-hydroxyacyl-CoA dehydrogenase